MLRRATLVTLLGATAMVGCSADEDGGMVVPSTYEFESRFDNASSVSYSGQVFRQVLIHELTNYIGSLEDDPTLTAGDVLANLNMYFDFDSTISGTLSLTIATDLPLEQTTFDDISSGKNLRGKLAGNDTATDHRDWSTEFAGWDTDGVTDPTRMVQFLFQELDNLMIARQSAIPESPEGVQIAAPYLSADGLDYKQLTHKFLLMAITFSQGHDDYLDDDVDGKGLLSPNTRDEDEPFSTLEHAWDEGFGYFGASRTYLTRTAPEIAASAFDDADQSGTINLLTEYSFGASVNAAKRDTGASVETALCSSAFGAFTRGRAIIAAAGDELTASELEDLRAQRDIALTAWEQAIAATVIHYLNDILSDMDAFGTDDYSFEDHAKHWAEMKGFSLGLQFSPRSALSSPKFAEFHDLVGTRPTLSNTSDIAGYKQALASARSILQQAYGFDTANIEGW